jgi:hypothetical protein
MALKYWIIQEYSVRISVCNRRTDYEKNTEGAVV